MCDNITYDRKLNKTTQKNDKKNTIYIKIYFSKQQNNKNPRFHMASKSQN